MVRFLDFHCKYPSEEFEFKSLKRTHLLPARLNSMRGLLNNVISLIKL